MKIHKYYLNNVGDNAILLPDAAEVLCVGEQQGSIAIWVKVDVTKPNKHRIFTVIATGSFFDDSNKRYVGTAFIPAVREVWHVFEQVAQ